MSQFQQAVDHIPQGAQGGATAASLFTMGAAFLEKIHGPLATIGVALGAAWVVLQMYLAIEKRWFNGDLLGALKRKFRKE
jgi:hypothetical protein